MSVPSLGHFHFFDTVPASGCNRERVLRWMRRKGAYALLAVRERRRCLARGEILRACSCVHATSDQLRVALLALDVRYCCRVARKDVDLRLRPHVPDACGRVTARRDKYVECWMEAKSVYSGKVTVIVTNDLVNLKIPTLDHLSRTVSDEEGT